MYTEEKVSSQLFGCFSISCGLFDAKSCANDSHWSCATAFTAPRPTFQPVTQKWKIKLFKRARWFSLRKKRFLPPTGGKQREQHVWLDRCDQLVIRSSLSCKLRALSAPLSSFRQTDSQTDGRTEGKKDRQTNRQTDSASILGRSKQGQGLV